MCDSRVQFVIVIASSMRISASPNVLALAAKKQPMLNFIKWPTTAPWGDFDPTELILMDPLSVGLHLTKN